MIFDTDVLIWILRGHDRMAEVLDSSESSRLSIVSYLELIQGAKDKREIKTIKSFLADCGLEIIPLTENIGHRAAIYMEEYSLKNGMGMADALIAATAMEEQLTLCTCNQKHYKAIAGIDLKVLRP